MRLIALAQGLSSQTSGEGQGRSPTPPSLAALEAARYAPLPPPRMGGFPPASVASGSGLLPAAATAVATSASYVSSTLAPAAATAVDVGGMGAAAWSAPGAPGGSGAGTGFGGGGLPHAFSSATAPAAPAPAAGSVQGPLSPFVAGSAAPNQSGGLAATPAAAAAATTTPGGSGEREAAGKVAPNAPEAEEDFGDFEGAEEEDGQTQPRPAAAEQGTDEEDFGDFSGAPAGPQAFAAASPPPAAIEAVAPGPTATGLSSFGSAGVPGPEIGDVYEGRGGASGVVWGAAEAWMMDGGEGSGGTATGRDSGRKGGLEDLIKSNLQAATEVPAHLADLVCVSG